jgi:hypothetical protein
MQGKAGETWRNCTIYKADRSTNLYTIRLDGKNRRVHFNVVAGSLRLRPTAPTPPQSPVVQDQPSTVGYSNEAGAHENGVGSGYIVPDESQKPSLVGKPPINSRGTTPTLSGLAASFGHWFTGGRFKEHKSPLAAGLLKLVQDEAMHVANVRALFDDYDTQRRGDKKLPEDIEQSAKLLLFAMDTVSNCTVLAVCPT